MSNERNVPDPSGAGSSAPSGVAANQCRVYLELLERIRPHIRTDPGLPERIRALLARDRRFGSRDRRLYRELLFTTIRYLPWIAPDLDDAPGRAAATAAWLAAETPDTQPYRLGLTGGWPTCPDSVQARAAILGVSPVSLLPDWTGTEAPRALQPTELEALHRRSPLWIRVQRGDPRDVIRALEDEGLVCHPSRVLDCAIRVHTTDGRDPDLSRVSSWKEGMFEVQDLGSQLVLSTLNLEGGERWLDACAGAGGKTLQLAGLIEEAGTVDAFDPRTSALEELVRRRDRAGLRNIAVLPRAPSTEVTNIARYDGVLVDAPCSGSGTWRRSPHLKWTTSAGDIRRHADRQLALLVAHAILVRPGGQLVYVTCSLASAENEGVARQFLEAHAEFEPIPPARDFGYSTGEAPTRLPPGNSSSLGLEILPSVNDTDGFYVAAFRRTS